MVKVIRVDDCTVTYSMGKLRKDRIVNGKKTSEIQYNADGTPKYKGNINVHVPEFGVLKFGLGNSKLPETTAYWSTLPGSHLNGGTCGFVASDVKKCEKDCYARRGMVMRPTLRKSYENNTNIARQVEFGKYLPNVIKAVVEVCGEHRGIKNFRIHESGDFFSQRYIRDWEKVIPYLWNNGVVPYCYTSQISLYNRLSETGIVVTLSDDWGIWKRHYRADTKVFAREDRFPKEDQKEVFVCPQDCRVCNWCSVLNINGKPEFATVHKH